MAMFTYWVSKHVAQLVPIKGICRLDMFLYALFFVIFTEIQATVHQLKSGRKIKNNFLINISNILKINCQHIGRIRDNI